MKKVVNNTQLTPQSRRSNTNLCVDVSDLIQMLKVYTKCVLISISVPKGMLKLNFI